MSKILHPKFKPRPVFVKRHTHSVAAGLEDALAIAYDMIREMDESRRVVEVRAKQLQEILLVVRLGPHAYDQDRPAGKRVKITRRFTAYDDNR